MDILRSYKILELDQSASIDEVRESYIDMARVWHPDGFTDNPRLKKRAEEKLKEINIAYAEIRALLSGGQRTRQTKQTVQWVQGAVKAGCKNTLAFKEIACDFCSFACTILRKTDFRQIFRQIFLHRPTLEEAAHRKKQTHNGLPGRAGRMDESRSEHRRFIDVYEEVARERKEKTKKAG